MTMKKSYGAPVADLVKFNYADQVVAASDCEMRGYNDKTPSDDGCNPGGYSK